MSALPSKNKNQFERFLHSQTSGSVVLMLATLGAVFWANSPWADYYVKLGHLGIGTHFNGRQYQLSLDHWVNDGLMTIFFFRRRPGNQTGNPDR